MTDCPYCGNPSDDIEARFETDPHGREMCDDCGEILETQWRMCYVCDEYGLAERESGVWICSDCGDMPDSLEEKRVASSAGDTNFEEIFGEQ
jgi:hypothetical protein